IRQNRITGNYFTDHFCNGTVARRVHAVLPYAPDPEGLVRVEDIIQGLRADLQQQLHAGRHFFRVREPYFKSGMYHVIPAVYFSSDRYSCHLLNFLLTVTPTRPWKFGMGGESLYTERRISLMKGYRWCTL